MKINGAKAFQIFKSKCAPQIFCRYLSIKYIIEQNLPMHSK